MVFQRILEAEQDHKLSRNFRGIIRDYRAVTEGFPELPKDLRVITRVFQGFQGRSEGFDGISGVFQGI